MAKQQPAKKPGGALKFAPSTFGQKKAEVVTEERKQAVRDLHASMCDEAEDGSPIYPGKTAFVVAAHKAGFTTREIAETLDMKVGVVYSMIWRKTSGYKPKSKSKANAEGAEGNGEDTEVDDDDLTDEELEADDGLTDEELEAQL